MRSILICAKEMTINDRTRVNAYLQKPIIRGLFWPIFEIVSEKRKKIAEKFENKVTLPYTLYIRVRVRIMYTHYMCCGSLFQK